MRPGSTVLFSHDEIMHRLLDRCDSEDHFQRGQDIMAGVSKCHDQLQTQGKARQARARPKLEIVVEVPTLALLKERHATQWSQGSGQFRSVSRSPNLLVSSLLPSLRVVMSSVVPLTCSDMSAPARGVVRDHIVTAVVHRSWGCRAVKLHHEWPGFADVLMASLEASLGEAGPEVDASDPLPDELDPSPKPWGLTSGESAGWVVAVDGETQAREHSTTLSGRGEHQGAVFMQTEGITIEIEFIKSNVT